MEREVVRVSVGRTRLAIELLEVQDLAFRSPYRHTRRAFRLDDLNRMIMMMAIVRGVS